MPHTKGYAILLITSPLKLKIIENKKRFIPILYSTNTSINPLNLLTFIKIKAQEIQVINNWKQPEDMCSTWIYNKTNLWRELKRVFKLHGNSLITLEETVRAQALPTGTKQTKLRLMKRLQDMALQFKVKENLINYQSLEWQNKCT